MSTHDPEFLKQLHAAFQQEAGEHLQAMVDGLLQLEKAGHSNQARGILENVFREAHSLKGAARAVNLLDVESVCQALESVFADWRLHPAERKSVEFDVVHQALDIIGQLVRQGEAEAGARAGAEASEGTPAADRVQGVLEKLHQLQPLGSLTPSAARAARPPAPSLLEPAPAPAASPVQLASASPVVGSSSVGPPLDPSPVTPAAPAAPSAATPPPAPGAPVERPPTVSPERPAAVPAPVDTVRIATDKLESLLRQAEEMLVLKLTGSQRLVELQQVTQELSAWGKQVAKLESEWRGLPRRQDEAVELTAPGDSGGLTGKVQEFLESSQHWLKTMHSRVSGLTRSTEQDRRTLGGMVDRLVTDAKKLSMLPFATLLTIFPKLVRDLCRDQDKQVELIVRGGGVEIDKRVLEEMKDPLIHLVRNCIDHAMEKPELRAQQQKPPQGTLTLVISQVDGNKIEILVADDGRGIDVARVRESAVKHGLISAAEASQLNPRDALALIFMSGVSTSPLLTELSGRGLGLAIVREKVERLGGVVSVDTAVGRGTTFRILVPVTLATFRGVLVRVADQTCVIPTAHVERALRVARAELRAVENQSTIVVDGRVLPLVELADVLNLPPPSRSAESDQFQNVLVLGLGDRRTAFAVDAVLQEQEVLVKSLGKLLRRVRNVAGATVLGTGKPAVILNVADLLKSAGPSASARRAPVPAPTPAEPPREKSILVVEDSITARMLLKNILETAGYQVTTTVDGVDAWTALKSERFDLIVSDIQMPRMNGFELTSKVRGDKQLGSLPVILVTGLASREDRERGIDVGANAYIVKRDFDQSNLLEVIQRLV